MSRVGWSFEPVRLAAATGRFDEAREIVERLRSITPVVIADVSHLHDPTHRKLYSSGLRLAAGEPD